MSITLKKSSVRASIIASQLDIKFVSQPTLKEKTENL
jgi:hypothetical protein